MATLENLDRQAAIRNLGLSIQSVFVPFSQSRNKNEKSKSLNWKITLLKKDKGVITFDYSAGIGHCPSYKQGPMNIYQKDAIDLECETGFHYRDFSGHPLKTSKKIEPNTLDVISSLIMDCDVMNYNGFEDWANSLGYNDDSIKAKKIFDTCVEIFMKIRNAIGDDGIKTLQEVFQDY